MFEMIYNNLIAGGALVTLQKGIAVTLEISALSVLFGTVFGAVVCWARMRSFKPLNILAQIYIAILRGSPVLMLLLLMYYVVFGSTRVDAVIVAVITYSLNMAAYTAELMRSALSATDPGQVEAARTLGFSRWQAFRLITVPQAARIASPVYESTIINLIQWTSVVGYITITDVTRVINTFSARTMQPVFMIIVGMLIYLGMSYLTTGIFALVRKLQKKEGMANG